MKLLLKIISSILFSLTFSEAFPGINETYLDSADYYIKKERFAEAADYYRKALKENPGSPINTKIFANLGMCLKETGEYNEALQAFEIALVRDSTSVNLLTSRAQIYLLMSRPEEARNDLNRALAVDSMSRSALLLRGHLALDRGEVNEALVDFTKILSVHPQDIEAITGTAICNSMLNNFDQSIDYYKKLIKVNPESQIYIALITDLINADRIKDADNEVNSAIREFPRCGELYLLRGVIHKINFRNDEAEIDRNTALNLGITKEKADIVLPKIRTTSK